MKMCENSNSSVSTQSIADYLAQLLKDRKQLALIPNFFIHVERLLDEGLYDIYFSFLCSLKKIRYTHPI